KRRTLKSFTGQTYDLEKQSLRNVVATSSQFCPHNDIAIKDWMIWAARNIPFDLHDPFSTERKIERAARQDGSGYGQWWTWRIGATAILMATLALALLLMPDEVSEVYKQLGQFFVSNSLGPIWF